MTTPTMRLLSWAEEEGPDVARDLASALTIAQEAYRGRSRRSGDPYITHPVAVAVILAEQGADSTTVITAILHDLDDVGGLDPAEFPGPETALRATFGDSIIDLLAAYTVLHRSREVPPLDRIDRRALAIKVADRLHNMRTIRWVSLESQRHKAAQTCDVVAPLARHLGLTAIGDELDSLATATLGANPPQPASRTTIGEQRTLSVRALRGTLRTAAQVLPAHCRERWIQEWEGELRAATSLQERFRFAIEVLRGLPNMAVLTRRISSQ